MPAPTSVFSVQNTNTNKPQEPCVATQIHQTTLFDSTLTLSEQQCPTSVNESSPTSDTQTASSTMNSTTEEVECSFDDDEEAITKEETASKRRTVLTVLADIKRRETLPKAMPWLFPMRDNNKKATLQDEDNHQEQDNEVYINKEPERGVPPPSSFASLSTTSAKTASSTTPNAASTEEVSSSEFDHEEKNNDGQFSEEEDTKRRTLLAAMADVDKNDKKLAPAKTLPVLYPMRIGNRSNEKNKPAWLTKEIEEREDQLGIETRFDLIVDDLIQFCDQHKRRTSKQEQEESKESESDVSYES